MYTFVDSTWNPIKGLCDHGCKYCYVRRWGQKQSAPRIDEAEMRTDLGSGNFIFVGSGCDMFARNIPSAWIERVLGYCGDHNNKYLFQSKNPARFGEFSFPKGTSLCTTIETNRAYKEIMGHKTPLPIHRAIAMHKVSLKRTPTYVTIEPIMDFDVDDLIHLIVLCNVTQVNIGADSGGNNLPEPSREKIEELISKLKSIKKTVHQKDNLKRLLKN